MRREGGSGVPQPGPSPAPPDWASRLGVWARQLVNRVVFQIDEEQEARMRAYLDETYGSDPVGGGDGPVQMGSLRPKRNSVRAPQPPSSHEEEVAQRLYQTLDQANLAETPGRKVRSLAALVANAAFDGEKCSLSAVSLPALLHSSLRVRSDSDAAPAPQTRSSTRNSGGGSGGAPRLGEDKSDGAAERRG